MPRRRIARQSVIGTVLPGQAAGRKRGPGKPVHRAIVLLSVLPEPFSIPFVDDDGLKKALWSRVLTYGFSDKRGRTELAEFSRLGIQLVEENGQYFILISYKPTRLVKKLSNFQTIRPNPLLINIALVDSARQVLRRAEFSLDLECGVGGELPRGPTPFLISGGTPTPRDVYRRASAVELAVTKTMTWTVCR